jgi:hypothetical protein
MLKMRADFFTKQKFDEPELRLSALAGRGERAAKVAISGPSGLLFTRPIVKKSVRRLIERTADAPPRSSQPVK